MKSLNLLKKTVLLALVLMLVVSCNNDDDANIPEPGTLNIVELALATPDLANLVAALQRANLAGTLQSGTYTVFAPSNAAFETFLSDNGFASLEDIPVDVLTQVLLNHVLEGEFNSSSLTTGYKSTLATESTTSNNLSIYIDSASGVKLNGISEVSSPNQEASNGVVHIVNKVIALPTVVDFALADNTFSTLVTALTRSDLTFDYVTTLSTPNGTAPAPFTVFAPTNDAFTDLLTELGAASLADIDEPTLKATLDLHAVAGANVLAASLSDNMTVTTLGGDITANVTGGATLTDSNGRVSNIIVTNVQAANGVIHVINKVVLPQLPPNIVTAAMDNPLLSNLVAALQAADGDLVSVLNGVGPFTVLAPDNDAFTAFLSDKGFASLGDVPTDILAQILLNHVISGSKLTSTDLVALGSGYTSTEAMGAGGHNMSLFFDTSSGVTFNGISNVDTPNIEVSNGVIHIVDAVIDIPTVVTFATADPTFSTLVDALTTLTPATDFVSILSTPNGTDPAPFTVFAPTNDAFGDITIPSDEATLTSILQHHVIAGLNVTSGDLNNPGDTTAPSLEGDNLTITLPGSGDNIANLTDGSGASDIGIIAVDVQAGNGVIHVINKVAIPDLTN